MNPFKTLNIKATDDKKAIKKAYAVLIKQYKPDENPEKFQEIQEAYKIALSMRQWSVQQNDSENKSAEPHQVTRPETHKSDESFSLQLAQVGEEALAEQKQQEQLIENLFQQLHQMAFAPLAVKSKLENWKFIEDYYKIDDLTLKPQIAREVFKKVAEYNVFQAKRNKTLLISAHVLVYLNQVFDWLSRWQNYQQYFPEHFFRVTFYYFDTDRNFKSLIDSRTNIFKRAWAFTVDFFILNFFLFSLVALLLPFDILDNNWLVLTMIALLRMSYELIDKSHASLGKKLNSMIVIDEYGNKCSYMRIFLRHLFLNIEFIPVVLTMISIQPNTQLSSALVIGFIFTLNFVTWVKRKGLFHDWISNTLVIDR